jgi:ketosteroid isomerase-like protein
MSEVTRRRIAALLLVAGIAVAALAIADVGPFDDPPTEEQRVQAAVEDFFSAAADGDSKAFCALLTDQARQDLEVSAAQRLQVNELPQCEKILDLLAAAFKGSEFAVRQISVSGNQARVEGRYRVAGEHAHPRTVILLEVNGEWRVSDPEA